MWAVSIGTFDSRSTFTSRRTFGSMGTFGSKVTVDGISSCRDKVEDNISSELKPRSMKILSEIAANTKMAGINVIKSLKHHHFATLFQYPLLTKCFTLHSHCFHGAIDNVVELAVI